MASVDAKGILVQTSVQDELAEHSSRTRVGWLACLVQLLTTHPLHIPLPSGSHQPLRRLCSMKALPSTLAHS